MRLEIPDAAQQVQTFLAIGVGAVLATIGGFFGTVLEVRLHHRHREQTAALTFGEILASLRVLLRAVEDAHGRGEPFGPLTMRLLRGARREVDAYDRSRAALSDLRSTDLRLSLHAVMIRITLGLDGVLEARTETEQEGGYSYLMSLVPKIDPLIRQLVPVAGQSVSPYEELSHRPEGRTPEEAPAAGGTATS